MKPSTTFEINQFDVVVVPFPFADDFRKAKPRPVVVINDDGHETGTYIGTMITTSKQRWKHDVAVQNLAYTGLDMACNMRMKWVSIDRSLIIKRIGTLSAEDRSALQKAIVSMIGLVA